MGLGYGTDDERSPEEMRDSNRAAAAIAARKDVYAVLRAILTELKIANQFTRIAMVQGKQPQDSREMHASLLKIEKAHRDAAKGPL